MRFESISIAGYRRLVEVHISFADGLTVVVGDNEVGKSTLHDALIRALYGFSKSERRKSDGSSVLDRCRPWRPGPNGYGLRAVLDEAALDGSKVGRLEVQWTFEDHAVRVNHADTGEDFTSRVKGKNQDVRLGEMLLGLSAEDFIDVCALRQIEISAVAASPTLKESLQAAVARRGGGNLDHVKERLTDAARELGLRAGTLTANPRGRLDSLHTRQRSLSAALQRATDERERLDELASRLASAIRDRTGKLDHETQLNRELGLTRRNELRETLERAERLEAESKGAVAVVAHDRATVSALRDSLATLNSELSALKQVEAQLEGVGPRVAQIREELAVLASEIQRLTPYETIDDSRLTEIMAARHHLTATENDVSHPTPHQRWNRPLLVASALIAIAAIGGAYVTPLALGGLLVAAAILYIAKPRPTRATTVGTLAEDGTTELEIVAALDAASAPLAASTELRVQAYVTACQRRTQLMQCRVRAGELERQVQALVEPERERSRRATTVETVERTIETLRTELGITTREPAAITAALNALERDREAATNQNAAAESSRKQLDVVLDGHTIEEIRGAVESIELELADHLNSGTRFADTTSAEVARRGASEERHRAEILVEQLATALEAEEKNALDPIEIDVELAVVNEEVARIEAYRAALKVALETLNEAATDTFRLYAPPLNAALEGRLSSITGGRYTDAIVRDDLSILVTAPETGVRVSVEELSRGTRDQILLTQRLAIASLLDETSGAAPLFLDDPFAHLDESRLQLALEGLANLAESRQIILFTEDERVSEAAPKLGARVERLCLQAFAPSSS